MKSTILSLLKFWWVFRFSTNFCMVTIFYRSSFITKFSDGRFLNRESRIMYFSIITFWVTSHKKYVKLLTTFPFFLRRVSENFFIVNGLSQIQAPFNKWLCATWKESAIIFVAWTISYYFLLTWCVSNVQLEILHSNETWFSREMHIESFQCTESSNRFRCLQELRKKGLKL